MEIKIYDKSANDVGMIEVSEAVFGLKWNGDLIHQVITAQLANRRRGTAHTKFRSEVRGGGKKPWRQKGTGRARHGSIRSPIWIGGGVTHGPRSEKSYFKKINKKMARKALFVALSAKARDNELIVMSDLDFPEAKTKHAASLVKNFANNEVFRTMTKGKGVLFALPGSLYWTKRIFRNLPYAGVEEARNLNAVEILKYKYILLPKEVIATFFKK